MRASDPFRRAAVLALAWWLVGLGIDPGPAPTRAERRRPAPAADGWRAQPPDQQAARLGQPVPNTSNP
jgi:hypothetical protein